MWDDVQPLSLLIGVALGIVAVLLVELVIAVQCWKTLCPPGKLLRAPASEAVRQPEANWGMVCPAIFAGV